MRLVGRHGVLVTSAHSVPGSPSLLKQVNEVQDTPCVRSALDLLVGRVRDPKRLQAYVSHALSA